MQKSDETSIIRCAACGVKIRAPSTVREFACPKCKAANRAQSQSPSVGAPPAAARSKSQTESATVGHASVGFDRYLAAHYFATRGAGIWWGAAGLFLGVPLLSFLKPLLGFKGTVIVPVALAVLSLSLGIGYFAQRLIAYFLQRERVVPNTARNALSRLFHGIAMLILPLAIVPIVEYFSPPEGLLAHYVPEVRAAQTRINLPAVVDPGATALDVESKELKDSHRDQIAQRSESVVKPSPQTNAGSAPMLPEKSSTEPSSVLIADRPRSNADSQESTGKQQNLTSKPTAAETEEAAQGAQTMPRAAISNRESPSETTPLAKPQQSEAGANTSQLVVAEGIGVSPDEALKDSFRNAVRQVVGAVVDAETLIKDDEVIDDKVLTYSDGFISGFEEIPGSKTEKSGLHRIKIKATVERRKIVAKLQAANVTVSRIDGKSLFAEAITQAEAEKNAATLLNKALADLPTLLTSEVVSKPGFDRETSEITLDIAVRVDPTAYNAYARRLEETLKGIAASQDTLLIKGKPVESNGSNGTLHLHQADLGIETPWGPSIPLDKNLSWCIWLCTSSTAADTTLRWNRYVIETDMQEALAGLQVPNQREHGEVNRTSKARTLINVQLLGDNGNVVTEDEFELTADWEATFESHLHPDDGWRLPFLRHFVARYLNGSDADTENRSRLGPNKMLADQRKSPPSDRRWYFTGNFYVAPYTFTLKEGLGSYGCVLSYAKQHTFHRRIKATLDELQRIKDIKCKVIWKPDDAR